MHKLAIFVEGQTEQLFLEQFVIEVAGKTNVTLSLKKRGTRVREFEGSRIDDDGASRYYVLIYDCAGYSSVVSDILDSYDSLVRAGHSRVLGLRDVYPEPRDKIPATRDKMGWVLRRCKIPVHVILCVMEIEAWFIGEYTHFARMYRRISLDAASKVIGERIETVDVEGIDEPTKKLREIYGLAGGQYSKKKGPMLRTIASLDFEKVYLQLPDRIPALKTFCAQIDEFLKP